MNVFSGHELIKCRDGYTLVLYVEKQTSEFGRDFLSLLNDKRKDLQKGTIDSIKSYIDENFHDIKIDTIKIMLGSLLVASISYIALENAMHTNKTEATGKMLKNQNSISGKSNSPQQQNKSREQKNSSTEKADKSPSGNSQNYNSSKSRLQDKNQLIEDNTDQKSKSPDPTSISADILVLVNKTHGLPADYVPGSLVVPNVPSPNKAKIMMNQEGAKALEALFDKARQDKIQLSAISGYRSYTRQKEIFTSNTIKYGSAEAANQFSARPGQSEHQTGLAMDVSGPSVNFSLTQAFAQTREGNWLKENAPHYGFILRYPKGKENITGYQFEPWHLRYVGKSGALAITDANITLEEFLRKPS